MKIDSNTATVNLLNPNELAKLLKISRVSVYRLVEQRKIPFLKINGSLRFDQDDIIAFLKDSRIEPI